MSTTPFAPQSYGPLFAKLISGERHRSLGAGEPEGSATLPTTAELFAHTTIKDHDAANCCLAAVYLLHDRLDESHKVSQSVETPEGSFWHGVMHRREGDYSNAKHWFRQAGDHPAYEQIIAQLGEQHPDSPALDSALNPTNGLGTWDPYAFVDLCQQSLRTGAGSADACRTAQQIEWECFFDWCYRLATLGAVPPVAHLA